jgi:hypothetical protein
VEGVPGYRTTLAILISGVTIVLVNPKVEIATSDDGMTLEKRLRPNSAMGCEFREKFETFSEISSLGK